MFSKDNFSTPRILISTTEAAAAAAKSEFVSGKRLKIHSVVDKISDPLLWQAYGPLGKEASTLD